MIKNRLVHSLVMAIAAVSLIWGYHTMVYASEETYEITAQFESVNKEEDGSSHFPLTEEKDGRKYRRSGIQIKVLKEVPIPREIITLEGEGFTGDPENHKPREIIEQEGVEYRLKEYSLIDTLVEEREKDISTVVPYRGVEFIDTLPEKGNSDVIDEDTGQNVAAKLPYQSHEEIRSYWDDSFSFPLTVVSYGAESNRLGEVEIPKDAELVLYGQEFLQYLGLPEDYYRILDIQWKGEVYERDGELRRDAAATGRKFVKDIEVTYAGTVFFEEIQAQAYNCVYERLPKEGESEVVYTLEATATYEQEQTGTEAVRESFWKRLLEWIRKHPVLAVVCLALILLVFWVLVFLFILAGKRRDRQKATEIVIHEENEHAEEDDLL